MQCHNHLQTPTHYILPATCLIKQEFQSIERFYQASHKTLIDLSIYFDQLLQNHEGISLEWSAPTDSCIIEPLQKCSLN